MSERDPNLEMSPRAFAIGMTALALYFAGAFYLTFYMLTYNPTFALRSAVLVRDPVPSVKVEIEFKELPEGAEREGKLSIRAPDGPPFHFQDEQVPLGPPKSRQVFVVPLDDENRSRLRRGANGPFQVSFYSGYGRSVRIEVEE